MVRDDNAEKQILDFLKSADTHGSDSSLISSKR